MKSSVEDQHKAEIPQKSAQPETIAVRNMRIRSNYENSNNKAMNSFQSIANSNRFAKTGTTPHKIIDIVRM